MRIIHSSEKINVTLRSIEPVHFFAKPEDLLKLESLEEVSCKVVAAKPRVDWDTLNFVNNYAYTRNYVRGDWDTPSHYIKYIVKPASDSLIGQSAVAYLEWDNTALMESAEEYINDSIGQVAVPCKKAYHLVNNEILVADTALIEFLAHTPKDPSTERDLELEVEELTNKLKLAKEKLAKLRAATQEVEKVNIILDPAVLLKNWTQEEIQKATAAIVTFTNDDVITEAFKEPQPTQLISANIHQLKTQRFKAGSEVQAFTYTDRYRETTLTRELFSKFEVSAKPDDISVYKFSTIGNFLVPDFVIAQALSVSPGDKILKSTTHARGRKGY